ncbi:MAG TPA: hypothetical protein VFA08_11745 [Actinomycetota bacterium]|nr:hypothetical protein [Actinomycetota bacterium]
MNGAPTLPVQERAANALRRVLAVAARVLRGLSSLATVAAISVTAAWGVGLADAPPEDANEWIARIVILAIALIPAGVLVLFVAGVGQLRELPKRARTLPADVRTRAAHLRDPSTRRRGPIATLAALFGLAKVVFGSREVLSPYAAISAVLRPAILVAALVAALAAVVEIPAAVLVILVLLA